MPSATGRSMLMRRWRRSRSALAKNGGHENTITGIVSTQLAQRSRLSKSGAIASTWEKYVGAAHIITCIMQMPATARRQSIVRVSARRRSLACGSCAGSGR